MSEPAWVEVSPDTLSVTHVFDGEEVVRGGEDGQTWIASFASPHAADDFIDYVSRAGIPVWGLNP